jgi:integrase
MPQRAITKSFVDDVESTGKDVFYWDTREKGFGLKVTAGGAKSYVYQYRLGGREARVQRYRIGAHGSFTPDLARKRAKELMLLVRSNVDPAQAEKVQRRQRVDLAFDVFAELFIKDFLVSQWRGGATNATHYLRKYAIPHFGRQALPEIKRSDISAMLSKINSVASRRNTFAVVRRLFRWAVGRGDLETSPVRDMEVPAAPPHRDRVLTNVELAYVWHAAAGLGYPFGPFVRLLILTGQRRTEVAGLNWTEVNRAERVWTLPSARSKNSKPHRVPLSDAVITVLDELAQTQSGGTKDCSPTWPRKGLVFTTRNSGHITGYTKAKRRLDERVSQLTLDDQPHDEGGSTFAEPWRFHDLRRTMATGMQRLKVRLEVTEACLNHTSGSRAGIVGVYQTHDYGQEKREALDLWAAEVCRMVGIAT